VTNASHGSNLGIPGGAPSVSGETSE